MTTTAVDSTIKVGAVLVSTWGYEQTNADFYRVTKVNNGWVTFQQVGTTEENDGGFMTAKATPDFTRTGKVYRRKLKNYGHDCVNISSYASASVWDNEPVSTSHYG